MIEQARTKVGVNLLTTAVKLALVEACTAMFAENGEEKIRPECCSGEKKLEDISERRRNCSHMKIKSRCASCNIYQCSARYFKLRLHVLSFSITVVLIYPRRPIYREYVIFRLRLQERS